jgi:hypothetical protein
MNEDGGEIRSENEEKMGLAYAFTVLLLLLLRVLRPIQLF